MGDRDFFEQNSGSRIGWRSYCRSTDGAGEALCQCSGKLESQPVEAFADDSGETRGHLLSFVARAGEALCGRRGDVLRTIQVLGYRKFAEFLADLRSHFVTRITPYSVLKAASKEKRTVADRIRHNIELDLRNLQFLQSAVDSERIIALSRRVKKARRILVVGIDLAASSAWYLAYGLMTLGFAAEAPIGSTGNVQRRVRTLTSRDLLIAISFGQCLRDTVEAAQRAKKQGVRTFGITDTGTSPLARICDDACFASVTSPSFVGSYVAPFSLMGALLTACAHTQTSRALELLRRSERKTARIVAGTTRKRSQRSTEVM